MYEKLELLETFEEHQWGEAYDWDDVWRIVETDGIRCVSGADGVLKVQGYEKWRHRDEEFMQLLPLLNCSYVSVKFAERGCAYYGECFYTKDSNGNWDYDGWQDTTYPYFDNYLRRNYVYPDLIDHYYADLDGIDFEKREKIHAVLTSSIGQGIANNERYLPWLITSYLFGEVDVPSMEDITDDHIMNYFDHYAALHNITRYGAYDDLIGEFLEKCGVDEKIIELYIKSG